MKAKHKRARFVIGSVVIAGLAVTLMLNAFSDNLVFFYTPTQWHEKSALPGWDNTREMRLGGLVKKGSIKNQPDGAMQFVITDLTNTVPVTYKGFVPSLFREGQGVVAQGMFKGAEFHAITILAKHDENYMPKEVVDALKKSGRWQQ